MHLLFSKLKVATFLTPKKKSIATKTDVEIPTLLPNILGQGTTSTRPICMDVGVLLLRYILQRLKKLYKKCDSINYISQTMFSRKIYPFPQAKKVNNFIVAVTMFNFSYTFPFFIFPPFECLSCISCYLKNFYYFLGGCLSFG